MNKGKAILVGTLALAAAAVIFSKSSPEKSPCETYAPGEHTPVFIELAAGDCDYAWPVSAQRIRVMCSKGSVTATDLTTNITYGVNGLAMEQGYPSIREIQLDGQALTPLLRLDLCN